MSISEERKLKAFQDLCQGSSPRPTFFVLVVVSTLIAAFGLVMNSTAVVIGAMLVAPLMTPILGLGLGLVRGDPHLIGIAMRAEVIGVLLSVIAAALLALTLPASFEPTPEMLSRTSPNLFDLLVAVLSGAAGAYALVDEKLSPVLPGVAISTAIVPPLANCGMCLALGALSGAYGSFLLFFTNFLSILLVSAIVFYSTGMAGEMYGKGGVVLVRRFGVAVIGFVLVSIFLSNRLVEIFDQRYLQHQIWVTLEQEFSDLRIIEMSDLVINLDNTGHLVVRADVRAPVVVGPRAVSAMQNQVATATGYATKLFVRTTLTQDVSATVMMREAVQDTLDGVRSKPKPGDRNQLLIASEQLIREYLEQRLAIHLENLNIYPFADSTVLLNAEISGIRQLSTSEIVELEQLLAERWQPDYDVILSVQAEVTILADKLGRVRTEFQLPGVLSVENAQITNRLGAKAKQWLKKREFWLDGWSATMLDGTYYLLLEVRSHRLLDNRTRDQLKARLAELELSDNQLVIYVHTKLDTVVGPNGYADFSDVLDEFYRRNREAYATQLETIIEQTR